MSKMNARRGATVPSGPIVTKAATSLSRQAVTRTQSDLDARRANPLPDTRTHEGAPAYSLDTRSELFTLAVTNLVGEDTFYEKADGRDTRFDRLVREVAVCDGEWFAPFLRWLRHEGNMRDAPIVACAQAVRARLVADVDDAVTNRALVASVLLRADEPGKLVDYWAANWGRVDSRNPALVNPRLPMPVKRGIADRLPEIFDEYAAFKYDTASKGVRFGDVVDLVHPADGRDEFYRWLIDRRHNRADGDYPSLSMLASRRVLESVTDPTDKRMFLGEVARGDTAAVGTVKAAGVTWEWLASWLGGALDASFWSAVIPRMGYMALLRNLANFDKTGVPDEVAAQVAARLGDPAQVAKSRQFPYRFLSAHLVGLGARWALPLDKALTASTANVPALPGRTLILVDTSGSMTNAMSDKSRMTHGQAAALFGVALAQRCTGKVDLVGFADGTFEAVVKPHAATLQQVEAFCAQTGRVGHGTQMALAVRKHLRPDHDRVVIISDMQTMGSRYGDELERVIPQTLPVYAFDTTGYGRTPIAAGSPNRHQMAGLTDVTFRMIPLIEAGKNAAWPWEDQG